MRIISGLFKGRRIQVPKNLPVRPTTDRSKEGLFNILHHRIDFECTKVLDLFSGTGGISYEFSSRGAKNIFAIDEDKRCVNFIQKTALEFEMDIISIQGECLSYLEKNSILYDLIFADPPYNYEIKDYSNIVILAKKKLSNNGIIIIEHYKQKRLLEIPGFSFERLYGNNAFSFFYL